MVNYVFELVLAQVFFNYLFLRNLNNTSIDTDITYVNLTGANPLQNQELARFGKKKRQCEQCKFLF